VRVEVTIEWLEGVVEKKKKFGMPYGIFCSQNDAESSGLLPHCIGSMLASRTLKLSLPFTDDVLFSAFAIPSAIHRQAPFGISCKNQDRGQNAVYVLRSRVLPSSSSIPKVDA